MTKEEIKQGDSRVEAAFAQALREFAESREKSRKALAPGYRLKRTAYEEIIEHGCYTADWFIDEYVRISARKSWRSRRIREFVGVIALKAMAIYDDAVEDAEPSK